MSSSHRPWRWARIPRGYDNSSLLQRCIKHDEIYYKQQIFIYIYKYFIFCCWATDSPTKTRHSNFKMFSLWCTLSTKIFFRRKYNIEISSKLGHLRVITNLFGFSKRSICHRSPLPGASAKLKSQHRDLCDFVLVVCIDVLHHFWWLVWTSNLCMWNSCNHFWLPFDLIFIQQETLLCWWVGGSFGTSPSGWKALDPSVATNARSTWFPHGMVPPDYDMFVVLLVLLNCWYPKSCTKSSDVLQTLKISGIIIFYPQRPLWVPPTTKGFGREPDWMWSRGAVSALFLVRRLFLDRVSFIFCAGVLRVFEKWMY